MRQLHQQQRSYAPGGAGGDDTGRKHDASVPALLCRGDAQVCAFTGVKWDDTRCLVPQDSLSKTIGNKTQVLPVKRALQFPAAYVPGSCAPLRRLLRPERKSRCELAETHSCQTAEGEAVHAWVPSAVVAFARAGLRPETRF